MSLDQSSIPGLGKGRLEALTDGIFATVMTVLVLSLSVPVIASNITGSQLSSDVVVDIEALWPNILGYVLSFLLLASACWVSCPILRETASWSSPNMRRGSSRESERVGGLDPGSIWAPSCYPF